ncbi:HPr family phosphocarrier protein [Marinimicrobium sp. ABcell2]|uniref:HPr family phosphocarrier protein n=1 Tax=Marinimicrobium sp. ABcell2 TaxID=3069751 RepID=UPI0027ADA300|nr:HPr family phosphocarrier protein [Marinimicrobium sp. ABcell2]MDQ2078278.1 HPr family phosphocarrier protein [Marinimicrobium sp. ABcell2]
MPSLTATIINKRGLHARAAAKFATLASEFECDIQARTAGSAQWVDGKSVMSLMLLAAAQGTQLEICAEGQDGDAAIKALCDLIDDYFEEGE